MKSWMYGEAETEELAPEVGAGVFEEVEETRDKVTMVIYSHLKDNIKHAVTDVEEIYKDEITKCDIDLKRALERQEVRL